MDEAKIQQLLRDLGVPENIIPYLARAILPQVQSMPPDASELYVLQVGTQAQQRLGGSVISRALREAERGTTGSQWSPQSMFIRFRDMGVNVDRSRELSNRLGQMDMSQWTDDEQDKYINEWAKTARSEQYNEAISNFQALYNPKTGRAWTEEQNAPNLQEQQAIQYGDVLKQRKLAEQQSEWDKRQGDMPSPNIAIQETLGRLKAQGASPNMLRFYENEARRLFTENDMAGLRKLWWEEKTRFPGVEPSGETGQENPEARREAEQPHKDWEERIAAQQNRPDPWSEFLKQQDFFTQFNSLTPQEKGEQPSRYRPPTRFL